MDNASLVCDVCHQPVAPDQYFCANCGNSLREKPITVSVLAQVGTYALSILLPPLGLWPGVKYLMKKSPQARWVGAIAIVLTIISSVVMIWAIMSLFQDYLNQMNSVLYP